MLHKGVLEPGVTFGRAIESVRSQYLKPPFVKYWSMDKMNSIARIKSQLNDLHELFSDLKTTITRLIYYYVTAN